MTPADIAWIAIGVVWFVYAFRNKATARRQPAAWLAVHLLILGIAIALLKVRTPRFIPDAPVVDWTAQALQILGIAFAIWARFHIGRNWSGLVTLKEDHALLRTGPYAVVRHPIYSGLLLAVLGVALGRGRLTAFLGCLLLFAEFKRKSLAEERLMHLQFGDAYTRYSHEVKALIPTLW